MRLGGRGTVPRAQPEPGVGGRLTLPTGGTVTVGAPDPHPPNETDQGQIVMALLGGKAAKRADHPVPSLLSTSAGSTRSPISFWKLRPTRAPQPPSMLMAVPERVPRIQLPAEAFHEFILVTLNGLGGQTRAPGRATPKRYCVYLHLLNSMPYPVSAHCPPYQATTSTPE